MLIFTSYYYIICYITKFYYYLGIYFQVMSKMVRMMLLPNRVDNMYTQWSHFNSDYYYH